MKNSKASAPGKMHFIGEHAVVYGKPALLVAIDKRCTVTVRPNKSDSVKIISTHYKEERIYTWEEIIRQTNKARKAWNNFVKTNEKKHLEQCMRHVLDYAAICIGEAIDYYAAFPVKGVDIVIESEIPSGMGSSAALAVSIVAAVSESLGKVFDRKIINTIAYTCEQRMHGNASGGDNAVCCYGGFVWYRKETEELKIIQPISIDITHEMQKQLYCIDTGKPSESTGEMVRLVKELFLQKPGYIRDIFDDQERLTRELFCALREKDNTTIRAIINKAEHNLESCDVVSDTVKKCIRSIEKSGGSAKISGAGGKRNGSGILVVYHNNLRVLKQIVSACGFTLVNVSFGQKGVCIDE